MNAATPMVDRGSHVQWTGEDGLTRTVFAVEGMRCAGCARSIERAIGALDGIERVQVNVATARVAVDWRADRTRLGDILRAVGQAGFRPLPLAGEQADQSFRLERRTAIKRIGLAGLGMMQVMMFVYGLYAADPGGIDPQLAQYLRVVSMLVATPVLLYSGAPFFSGAWQNLKRRTLGMDVPVAAAIALAYGASVFNTLRGEGEVYFDSVTMFIFFLLTGRFVEMTVRQRSLSGSEALARSVPATALRVRPGGSTERVHVGALASGDRISIPRGSVVPVDCELLEGEALVDESLVTGEAKPVLRRAGERLLGGSVNIGHPVHALARTDVAGSTIASLVSLLERGRAERPRLASAADRAAARFVFAILLLSAAVAIGWWIVDPSRAFEATLAVLVVTCPCALSLATPAVLAAATSRLTRLGLLVTNGDAIERLARVTTVMIDKTGTLTTGAVRITRTHTFGELTQQRARAIAAALERDSSHPLAAAFGEFAEPGVTATEIREYPGAGVEGCIDGVTWRLGRAEFALAGLRVDDTASAASTLDAVSRDAIVLASPERLEACFVVAEDVRSDAKAAIDRLRSAGLEVVIASGDGRATVSRTAAALGIEEAYGRLTPEQKVELLRERQRNGKRVLMIGDGINDGPVLAAADVSCAMGEGSAVAQAAADLLLLNPSLGAIAAGVATARRALGVMRQNLTWALAYNVCAVPLAALGFVPPWVAAIGMSASSLVVVLNAGRVARSPRARSAHARVLMPLSPEEAAA